MIGVNVWWVYKYTQAPQNIPCALIVLTLGNKVIYRIVTFLICPLYVFVQFSASFLTAYYALDLARDHAP